MWPFKKEEVKFEPVIEKDSSGFYWKQVAETRWRLFDKDGAWQATANEMNGFINVHTEENEKIYGKWCSPVVSYDCDSKRWKVKTIVNILQKKEDKEAYEKLLTKQDLETYNKKVAELGKEEG
jgi:hypothetical protein